MLVSGILGLFSIIAGTIALTVVCVPGIAFLFIVYNRIYKKYKRG
jgi:hypothetical protein